MLNDEIQNAFSLGSETQMPTLTTGALYYAASPRNCNKARKINKWHKHKKEGSNKTVSIFRLHNCVCRKS